MDGLVKIVRGPSHAEPWEKSALHVGLLQEQCEGAAPRHQSAADLSHSREQRQHQKDPEGKGGGTCTHGPDWRNAKSKQKRISVP